MPCYIGLDVSKAVIDAVVRPTGEVQQFANDATGHAALLAWAQPLAPATLVLEATGGYERAAGAALLAAGLPAVVVNPRQVRDFARSTGQSRFRCGHASGNRSKSANVQRQKDKAAGGTRSRAARPTIELPAQNSAVTVSSG